MNVIYTINIKFKFQAKGNKFKNEKEGLGYVKGRLVFQLLGHNNTLATLHNNS